MRGSSDAAFTTPSQTFNNQTAIDMNAASDAGNKHCKLFNCATGLIFTDYLARLRVEKAKALLLDRTRNGASNPLITVVSDKFLWRFFPCA
jgi:hypothetical protein